MVKRIHSGQIPYPCNQCLKAFSNNGDLNKYLRTHYGEKPHPCNQCPKTFSADTSQKKQFRLYSGENQYSCNQCSKAFSQNGHLKQHLRIPVDKNLSRKIIILRDILDYTQEKNYFLISGEKPHPCNKCPKTFSGIPARRNTLQYTQVKTNILLIKILRPSLKMAI